MTERFILGRLSTSTSAILLNKVEPLIVEHCEELLDIKSCFTLSQGDGPPRSTIQGFEPKPKPAKNIEEGDVILSRGSSCRVLKLRRRDRHSCLRYLRRKDDWFHYRRNGGDHDGLRLGIRGVTGYGIPSQPSPSSRLLLWC